MEKYTFQKEIGSGSFAVVSKALNKETNEVVAIKKMKRKFSTWEECLALREVKCLMNIRHANIIQLKEVFRCQNELFLVFEYVCKNVYQLYLCYKNKGETMPEREIKSIVFQAASALAHLHKHGYFHRDLKPENMCVDQNNIVKLIDFGLAREIRSAPPFTDYVATRWYRAPEIIMKAPNYNSPVDIFALGCIMAELYLMSPIFCGNSEIDQLHKVFSILGTPNQSQWQQGYKLASQNGISFPQYEAIDIGKLLQSAGEESIALIKSMLQIDPMRRPTSHQILNQSFFEDEKERGNGLMKPQEHHHVSKSSSPNKYSPQETSVKSVYKFEMPNKPQDSRSNQEEAKYNFSLPNSFNQQNNLEQKNAFQPKANSSDIFSYNPSIKAPSNLKMANQEAFKHHSKAENPKTNDSRFQANIGNFLGMNMNDDSENKNYGRHKLY